MFVMDLIYEKGYKIADVLTLARFFIVFILLALIPGKSSSVDQFMVLLLIAWLTDCLDGYFARKSKRLGALGSWDGWVDTIMYLAVFLYCTVMGYYSVLFFITLIVLNFCLVFFTKNLEVNQAFQFLYIIFGFRTLLEISTEWSLIVILWTIFVIIFKWNRFKWQVVNFISSFKNLLTKK